MPLLHTILQRWLMHCISIPYTVSSQSIWEYWCPPLAVEIPQWVISLFLVYLVSSSVGFRAKAQVNEILKFTSFKVVIPEHVLKDLDAKNESRLVRCPGTSKFICRCWSARKADNMSFFAFWVDDCAPNSPNAMTWWQNTFLQEAVWTELQHHAEATAVPLAFKGSFDWFHYVILHHSFFVGSQFLGRCMTWTMKSVLHHQPIMIEYVLVRVNRPLHRCSSVALKFYVTVAPGSSDSRRSLGAKPYPTCGSPGKALSFR